MHTCLVLAMESSSSSSWLSCPSKAWPVISCRPAGAPTAVPDEIWVAMEELFPHSSGKRIELFGSHEPLDTRPGWTHIAYEDMLSKPSFQAQLGEPYDRTAEDFVDW